MSQTPIIDQQRGYREWLKREIYTGPSGTGPWVPNVDDAVRDWDVGLFRVTSVDYTTGLSTMIPWHEPDSGNGVIANDVLLGSGPGSQSESYRMYVDTTVVPHTLALDGRLHIYSSQAAYCKVFVGTDITATGLVVSAQVDQNGNVTTENLSLSNVATSTQLNNTAIKAVNPGVCTANLQDGEVVTAVIYAANGTVLSYSKMLVSVTDFIRTTDAYQKYVTSIELLSPFRSSSDNSLINVPINVMIQSTALQGKVHYSDGSSIVLPIDGTRFQLAGLSNYVASVVGQHVPLVLIYNFAPNEYGYQLGGTYPNRFMTANYSITTTELVGAYSVKIYTIPVWNTVSNQYQLKYFLYNLDRNAVYDVTSYVQLVAPNGTFSPLSYNNTQTLTERLDLSSIGASYAYYIQTQTIDLNLLTPGTSALPNWWVQYSPGGAQYGGNIFANVHNVSGTNYTVDLSSGKADLTSWLQAFYYDAEPLFDPIAEGQPLAPNFVRVKIGSFTRTIGVSEWDTVMTSVTLTTAPNPGEVALLEFILDTGTGVLELGIGAMPIRIV